VLEDAGEHGAIVAQLELGLDQLQLGDGEVGVDAVELRLGRGHRLQLRGDLVVEGGDCEAELVLANRQRLDGAGERVDPARQPRGGARVLRRLGAQRVGLRLRLLRLVQIVARGIRGEARGGGHGAGDHRRHRRQADQPAAEAAVGGAKGVIHVAGSAPGAPRGGAESGRWSMTQNRVFVRL